MLLFVPSISEGFGKGDRFTDVISKLLEKRVVMICGVIDDQMAMIVCAQLLLLDSMKKADISLYINSVGGSVYSGLAICDTIRYCRNKVITVCLGSAFSAASLILSCGSERLATPYSRIMVHQASIRGAGAERYDDFRSTTNELKFINKLCAGIYAKNSKNKLTQQDAVKLMKTDRYMDPEEAIKLGLLDSILRNEKDKTLTVKEK